jgi:hypothetical protein
MWAAASAALLGGTVAKAALVIEPVFNRVPGSGPADNNFPLYDPDFQVNGVSYWTADEPGEVVSYASGDPRDPWLDILHVWNNTHYTLTGFTLKLIGTATDSEDPGTIVRGPVDAVWGDVNGDSMVGVSDIFSTVVVSPDGKEIHFEGGLIPVGGRFTDIHLAASDHPPDFAGIDATFTGIYVPEPGCMALLIFGAALIGTAPPRRRSDPPRPTHRAQSQRRYSPVLSSIIVATAATSTTAAYADIERRIIAGRAQAVIETGYLAYDGRQDEIIEEPEVSASAGLSIPGLQSEVRAFQSVHGINAVEVKSGDAPTELGKFVGQAKTLFDFQLATPQPETGLATFKWVIHGGEMRIRDFARYGANDTGVKLEATIGIDNEPSLFPDWRLLWHLSSPAGIPHVFDGSFDQLGAGRPPNPTVQIIGHDAVIDVPRIEREIQIDRSMLCCTNSNNRGMGFRYEMSAYMNFDRDGPIEPAGLARIGDPFSLSSGGPSSDGVEFFLDGLPLSSYPYTMVPEPTSMALGAIAVIGLLQIAHRRERRGRVPTGSSLALCLVILIPLAPTNAATFHANTVTELIAAIDAANQNAEPDSISLAAGATFTLETPENGDFLPTIAVPEVLTIQGNGSIFQRGTGPSGRLLRVAAAGSLVIENVTLQQMSATGVGGAIRNAGQLVLRNVTVESAGALGVPAMQGRFPHPGGPARGGGIYSLGSLLVQDCTFRNNWARGGRGDSSLPGGHASGGGLYIGGGSATLLGSTITGNEALGGAPGIVPGLGIGGGIYIEPNAAVQLDEFTLAHTTGNLASTSHPDVFGSYELIPNPNQSPGDFNHDGAADAADYVVWRKGLGATYAQDDYNIWQANFGAMLNPGSGASSPLPFPLTPVIPEPSTILLAVMSAATLLLINRSRAVETLILTNQHSSQLAPD